VRSVDRLRDLFDAVGVDGEVTLEIERTGRTRTVVAKLRRIG